MATHHIPIANTWYSNTTGTLLKVRLIGYGANGMENILLEYPADRFQLLDIKTWNSLDLRIHCLPARPRPKIEQDSLN